MNEFKPSAFTSKSNGGKFIRLTSEIVVVNNQSMEKTTALWDTGATRTCISKDIVKKLGLIPTGKQKVQTPSGIGEMNTYLVSIMLPNAVLVKDVMVIDSEIGSQGLGVLVGMDIITLGDFALTNNNGNSTFSFVIPSIGEIDFEEQLQ